MPTNTKQQLCLKPTGFLVCIESVRNFGNFCQFKFFCDPVYFFSFFPMPYIPATKIIQKTVADPGFPRGGGANSRGRGGEPTYDFAKFSKKLHEIERIWTPVGGGGGRASKILLCRSATAKDVYISP